VSASENDLDSLDATAASSEIPSAVDGIWRRRRRAEHGQLGQIAGVTVLLVVVGLLASNDYQYTVLGLMMIYAIAGIGFYLILGMSGQFAFSHAATLGLGAYTAAFVSRDHGFWLSLLAALVVCAVISAAFKLLLWRASDFYFGIATLGLAEIAVIVFQAWQWFTGPAGNANILTVPNVFGWQVNSPSDYYWFFIAFFVVGMLVVYFFRSSAMYRETIAVRDKPLTAAGLGIRNTRNQLVVYVIGSCYAAVAGALFAQDQGFISASSFDLNLGIDLFVVVIVGGMYSMWGALVGAAFVVVLPQVIQSAQNYSQLIFATLLVVTIVLLPGGLMGLVGGLGQRARRIAGRVTSRKAADGGTRA
jgi:branched-chain amino acid transport system permease protein